MFPASRDGNTNTFAFPATGLPGAFDAPTGPFSFATGYSEGVDYSYLWTLARYRNSVNKDEHVEDWDELEKSVIASVADGVIVGVKGKQADIVIVKKFA